jgi:hypothetical protein
MRKRIDERCVHGENRVEQVSEANAMCLCHEAERGAVAVEAPRAALLDYFESSLVMPVEDLVSDAPRGVAIDERQRIGAVPLDVHDCNQGIGQDAANTRAGCEVFESHISSPFPPAGTEGSAQAKPGTGRLNQRFELSTHDSLIR